MMKIKELEQKIEEMRIQYAKENWSGDVSNLTKQDLISIYIMLLTKEELKK